MASTKAAAAPVPRSASGAPVWSALTRSGPCRVKVSSA
jgi:hypothetical protein